MAITFPTTLDALSNPASSDAQNANGGHALQHANANDAIEALEAKVGIDGSAVTTSLSYKLSAVTGSEKALTSGTSTQSVTGLTLTTPVINIGSDATGDMYYRSSGALTRLAIGTSGQILSASAGGLPTWIANPSAADASSTIKGVTEIATQAEYDAGTGTPDTTAPLVPSIGLVRARLLNTGVVDTGSSTAYAIAPTPAITAYASYQEFTFKAVNANTTTTPTLNVNSIGAKTIINPDGSALAVGQIPANSIQKVVYDGTNFQIQTPFESPFSVGTKLSTSYYTYTVPMVAISATALGGWTHTTTSVAAGSGGGFVQLGGSGSADFIASTLLPGTGSNDNYTSAQTKTIRFKARIKVADTSDRKSWGFVATASTINTAQTDITNTLGRFVLNTTTLYVQNANGTATAVDVSAGITVTNWNDYEIIATPGTDVKFYINGTLVSTSTTNIPSSGSVLLAYGCNANGRVLQTFPPTISIQN